ncbi:MAG: anthranilate synthase component I family protein [Saprospiraceae bacterium]
MRHTATFPIDDLVFWKKQLLYWAAGHELGVYLDSNTLETSEVFEDLRGWECLAAAEAFEVVEARAGNAFEQLRTFQKDKEDWLFGFFCYDLKNEVEQLNSQHFDGILMPDLGFFRPGSVVGIKPVQFLETSQVSYLLEIQTLECEPEVIFSEIKTANRPSQKQENVRVKLQPRIPKSEYLQTVETIRQHIAAGDIYEMNFCQEFFAENVMLDPVAVFERLNIIGKAPFATFLRWRDRYLLSASPERFLKKTGQKLITQPIKGTRRREKTAEEDEQIRQALAASEKDRSENVMIVDLVRNDLSRNCLPGSVVVEELCGIYSFATVHQMISTVSGVLPKLGSLGSLGSLRSFESLGSLVSTSNDPNDVMTNATIALQALRDCFPMGSMTGAPKIMSMELIERYERTRRGLYSGAVGYFAPDGDFDFNVVIRSILYNAATRYVSAQVGGAIVYDSVPEQEYEECMVKAEAMMRALEAGLGLQSIGSPDKVNGGLT